MTHSPRPWVAARMRPSEVTLRSTVITFGSPLPTCFHAPPAVLAV